MVRKNWSRDELIIAFNLYCKIPFSKINYRHKRITELAELIGRTPSAVAWKLVNFASLDPSLQKRGIKGAKNTSKLDEQIFDEFNNDWDKLVYESEILYTGLLENTSPAPENLSVFDDNLIKSGKERETIVKVRINQSFFRKAVLSSYNNQCCITGLNFNELLVASHIIPWSKDEKNRLNPRNGLCLNSLHDKAFDRGLITIEPNYKIRVSEKIRKFTGNTTVKNYFLNYENKMIILPKRFIPDEEFLKYHNDNIFLS